jgi:hypothetical protein
MVKVQDEWGVLWDNQDLFFSILFFYLRISQIAIGDISCNIFSELYIFCNIAYRDIRYTAI